MFGLAMVLYGTLRQAEVDSGIRRGEYVAAGRRVVVVLTAMSALIGLGTLVLILFQA